MQGVHRIVSHAPRRSHCCSSAVREVLLELLAALPGERQSAWASAFPAAADCAACRRFFLSCMLPVGPRRGIGVQLGRHGSVAVIPSQATHSPWVQVMLNVVERQTVLRVPGSIQCNYKCKKQM
jgi:hypothetical protein